MTVARLESIRHYLDQPGYFVKFIFTNQIAVFFPGTIQHRDVKLNGASYEDDYRGNALAATVTPGRIDIRFHQHYSDDQVRTIIRNLMQNPEMTWARSFLVMYQGRTL